MMYVIDHVCRSSDLEKLRRERDREIQWEKEDEEAEQRELKKEADALVALANSTNASAQVVSLVQDYSSPSAASPSTKVRCTQPHVSPCLT